jgi:carbon monoxide dehydrogenase subunit G
MATHVEIDIHIDRPPDEVFAFISNFANNPQWQKGMDSCTVTSDGEFGVGSTYDQVAHMANRQILSSFEVVEYDPGRKVKATTTKSTFPITFTRVVDADRGGSRVRAIIEGDATGIFKVLGPVMNLMVKRSINADYVRLKVLLEGRATNED